MSDGFDQFGDMRLGALRYIIKQLHVVNLREDIAKLVDSGLSDYAIVEIGDNFARVRDE